MNLKRKRDLFDNGSKVTKKETNKIIIDKF